MTELLSSDVGAYYLLEEEPIGMVKVLESTIFIFFQPPLLCPLEGYFTNMSNLGHFIL